MGRKEKEKTALLRRIVLRQREQLKARNAENRELRDIIKAVQVLQISNKRASEGIDLLLQRANDDKHEPRPPESSIFSPPMGVLPLKTTLADGTSARVLHSREKSTVSSSAGTTSTSSSVSVNPKELRKRVHNLEGKMKAMLKTMKDNEDLDVLNHAVKHDVRHDSGYESMKLSDSPRSSVAL